MDLEALLTLPAAAISFGLLWLALRHLERRNGPPDRRRFAHGGRRASDIRSWRRLRIR
jgi:hypothetical protein